jgi:hypothetical protein
MPMPDHRDVSRSRPSMLKIDHIGAKPTHISLFLNGRHVCISMETKFTYHIFVRPFFANFFIIKYNTQFSVTIFSLSLIKNFDEQQISDKKSIFSHNCKNV